MKIKTLLMMFVLLTAFLFTSCISAVNPLNSNDTPELYPIMQNRKIGYINHKGEVVIRPQFEVALFFSEGLAAACIEHSKCGYIDETGKYAINPQFESARRFSEGLAAVEVQGKVGYIDKTGKIIINPQFDSLVKSDSAHVTDVLCTFSEGLARVGVGEKYGFIDKTGKYVINPQFEYALPFFEGMAAVAIGNKKAFVDKEGKFVINPQFDEVLPFINGLAAVKIGEKYGFIDKTGKIVINPQFDYANPFSSDGIALVSIKNKAGFIDKEGKYIINPQFDHFGLKLRFRDAFMVTSDLGRLSFSEGMSPVQVGERAGYIDKSGKIVINPQFDGAFPFYGDLAVVFADSGFAYIDKEGRYVWRETKETPGADSKSSMSNANMAFSNSNSISSNSMSNSNVIIVTNNNTMNSSVMNSALPSSNSYSSSERTGRLTTDSNIRSEPNRDAASLGIHFKDAGIRILDETSYEINGTASTWYKIRVTEYGCSKDTSLGCGKNSSNDADEGWVNAKVVLLN